MKIFLDKLKVKAIDLLKKIKKVNWIKVITGRVTTDILLSVVLSVFLVSACNMLLWAYDSMYAKSISERLNEDLVFTNLIGEIKEKKLERTNKVFDDHKDIEDILNTPQVTPSDYDDIKFFQGVNIEKLKRQNSDTVGWIYWWEMGISEVVVQAEDNAYYIDHDFEKYTNSAGAIFLDYRNKKFGEDPNSIIYGHARADGQMFGKLLYVFRDYFYERPKSKYIWIETEDDSMVFEIFSAYNTDIYFNYIRTDFRDKYDYARFLKSIATKNEVPTYSGLVSADDVIITLSTCRGPRGTEKRIAIHAKLVKSKKDPTLKEHIPFKEKSESD